MTVSKLNLKSGGTLHVDDEKGTVWVSVQTQTPVPHNSHEIRDEVEDIMGAKLMPFVWSANNGWSGAKVEVMTPEWEAEYEAKREEIRAALRGTWPQPTVATPDFSSQLRSARPSRLRER